MYFDHILHLSSFASSLLFLAEVFLPDANCTSPSVTFLQELPSYRSILRRRTSAGGTQDRRQNNHGFVRPPAAEKRNLVEGTGVENDAVVRSIREYALNIPEKRRRRLDQ